MSTASLRSDHTPLAELFEYMQQPPYWIVRDADGYWLVPAQDGGWHQRTPFVGHVRNLRPLTDGAGIVLGRPDDAPL